MTQKADENINILAFSRRRLLSQSNLAEKARNGLATIGRERCTSASCIICVATGMCIVIGKRRRWPIVLPPLPEKRWRRWVSACPPDVPSPDFFPFYPFH